MKKILWVGVLFLSSVAFAAPKLAELTRIYDQQNAAMASGDMERILLFRTAKTKTEIKAYLKTPQDRKELLEMSKAMVPISYTIDQQDISDKKATLYLTGTFHSMEPKKKGKEIRQEMLIFYTKEGGQWKIDNLIFAGDPDKVKRSPNDRLEPESHFRLDASTHVGGRLVQVKFEKDHTLLAIRVLDEEILLFFPAKELLEKSGFHTNKLVPGQLIEATGCPHKSNSRKILGRNLSLIK